MDNDFDLADALQQAALLRCPACKTENPSRAATCRSCGAALTRTSAADAGGDEAPRPAKVPLDQSKNYRALHRAASGILDGSVSEDEYLQSIRRLQFIADAGLRLVESEAVESKFPQSSAEQKTLSEEMRLAFTRLRDGLERMQSYLQSRQPQDVREGCAQADLGFILIDQIEDRALALGD